MAEKSKEFCIHYQAMAYNQVCKKGVEYKTLQNADDKFHDLPCWNDAVKGCPLAEYPSPEQVKAREERIAAFLESMAKFSARETDICIHCGKRVVSLRKIGRCVYGSCGCRMWQGSVPKAWK